MINMSTTTNAGGDGSSSASGIRNSVFRHLRKSTISLSRSGSRRSGDKSDDKAAKRLSMPFIFGGGSSSSPTSTPKSPEPPAVELAAEPPAQSEASNGAAPAASQGISLHVTVHIAPENVDRFIAAFKPVFDLVVAEPECTFFQVYQSPEEPGKLSWVENWSKDTQWLVEHQITKPYYKEYLEITEPMFLKPREATILQPFGSELFMFKGNPL
ncbi:hypothetical protein GGR52DRAFT_559881 [Hypoxylon sp. FL1284]|nr:hypothetical protein GGR52DRAFT_559881 [Hypoxylon sp. FL1284]